MMYDEPLVFLRARVQRGLFTADQKIDLLVH